MTNTRQVPCIGTISEDTPSLLNMIISSDCVRVEERTPKELRYRVLKTFSVNVNNNFPTWHKDEVVLVDMT